MQNIQTKGITYTGLAMRLIATERMLKGLDQQVLADALGVNKSSYSRLETGQTALTVDALFVLCRALGLSPVSLLTRVEALSAEAASHPELMVTPHGAQQNSGVAELVTGAALGALITAMLTKR